MQFFEYFVKSRCKMNRLLDVFYIYQTNTNALEWTIIVLQWKELAVASRSFETIVLVVAGRSNSAVHYFVLLVITAVIAFAVAVFAMFRSNSPLRCFRRVHYFKFTFSFIFDDANLCRFFRSLSLSLEFFLLIWICKNWDFCRNFLFIWFNIYFQSIYSAKALLSFI